MDIELFDRRYVYLEWSDKLEGKDCILATSYKNLKDFVNSGDEGRFCKVDKGNEKPFTNHWRECDFCYYDPNLKVKKALIEGKKVQYYSSFDKWEDLNLVETCNIEDYLNNEDWDEYEWRIKPEYNYDIGDVIYYRPKFKTCFAINTTESKYYLSINKNNYLEYTISPNINDAIYNGTKKECERMVKIISNELGDCGGCKSDGMSCSYCSKLRYIIDKYSHEKYKRRMTNRELSQYLAKGNGEMKYMGYLINTSTCFWYQNDAENKNVDYDILIRDFGSDEWRKPLIEV